MIICFCFEAFFVKITKRICCRFKIKSQIFTILTKFTTKIGKNKEKIAYEHPFIKLYII